MFCRSFKSLSSKIYDLVVIGAGSGGLQCAWDAAELYKAPHVAVIDQQKRHGPPYYSALGGTCVNVGCVPKKLFVTGAVFREHLKDSRGFGWNVRDAANSNATGGGEGNIGTLQGNWKALVENKNKVITNINKSYQEMFNDKLEFHLGFGRFASPNEVECIDAKGQVTETLKAKIIVINTGAWPQKPSIPGIEHTISSNEAFYLESIPRRVLVVGGGYIAVEFASIFNAYKPMGKGVEGCVTIAYRKSPFLRGFDMTVRQKVSEQMEKNGVRLLFNENPAKIELNGDGSKKVTFEKGRVEDFDMIMYATGRKPKTDKLLLEKVGVKQCEKGGILVDKENKTNVDSIYAIGDVVDKIQLTPVAIHEGACLAATLFNNEKRYPDYTNIASAVFSIPHIGTCGLTEEDAVTQFPNIDVYMTSFVPLIHQLTGASYKENTFKIICNADNGGEIMGVHLVCMEAPELIQIISVAMKMGVNISNFYNTIGVHPTSAEDLTSMREPAYSFRGHKKLKKIEE